MSRLPPPIKGDNGGTNLYASVPNGGAPRQLYMLKMLTGGKKGKKGGAQQIPVPQFPNGGAAANLINKNLLQIAVQGGADRALDNAKGLKGGRRRRKTGKSRKRNKTHKRRKTARRRRNAH